MGGQEMWGDGRGLQQPLFRARAWGRGDPLGTQGVRAGLHGRPCWVSVLGSLLAVGPVAEDAVCRASGAVVGMRVQCVAVFGVSIPRWHERHEHVVSVLVLSWQAHSWRWGQGGRGAAVCSGGGMWAAMPWAWEGAALCSPITSVSAPCSLPAPGLSPDQPASPEALTNIFPFRKANYHSSPHPWPVLPCQLGEPLTHSSLVP